MLLQSLSVEVFVSSLRRFDAVQLKVQLLVFAAADKVRTRRGRRAMWSAWMCHAFVDILGLAFDALTHSFQYTTVQLEVVEHGRAQLERFRPEFERILSGSLARFVMF